MSNREENGCFRRLKRTWANFRNNFANAFSRVSGRRRSETARPTVSPVVLVRTSPISTVEPSNNNWVDPWIRVRNRTPPRKRYHHDRSPDTLLQIKIALQEQEIKDILSEEIQKSVFNPEVEGESGEKVVVTNANNDQNNATQFTEKDNK